MKVLEGVISCRDWCYIPRMRKVLWVAIVTVSIFIFYQSPWFLNIRYTYTQRSLQEASVRSDTLKSMTTDKSIATERPTEAYSGRVTEVVKPTGSTADDDGEMKGEPELIPPRRKVKSNLMFVKTHKCGTSSLVNLFYLYGVRHRLNFVIQVCRRPHILEFEPFPNNRRPLLQPRPGGVYNIQCQHGTFVPRVDHQLLPKATSLYSTIVRSPVSHFKSAFAFFGAQGKMRKKYAQETSLDDLINHYLDGTEQRTGQGAELSRQLNSAALDLGYNTFTHGLTGTLQDKIDAFIAHLDTEMDYVMITDRMDESLVLLKEFLGWNMTDILYLNRMVSGKQKESISEATQERILKYQIVDRQIFEHFNASFQRHVDNIGREKVSAMVEEFRELRETFENKCFDKSQEIAGPYQSVTWAITDYGKTKNMACTFLQTRDVILTKVITELQLSQDYTVPISIYGRTDNGPYRMQSIVTQLQRDYDNNEDPV